ncbi:MAG: geranyl transferase [Alphaproteobacteria bacterium CG_4_10_14_0_8_um_filter_53_9]|nr:MAG: geranyl transferase [Alphaproteobacteria bacterium CG_4_10_14_0_8_um_filter_53_9]
MISSFLARVSEDISHVLEEILTPPAGLTPPEQRLFSAMDYAVQAGGKRVRPALVLAAYEACGGTDRALALRLGAAVEMVHTYTLIQDDLPCMDDDNLRRGKPTTHVAFDEATAILASDGLQVEAFKIVACELPVPSDTRLALLDVFLEASSARGVLGGQMIDILYEKEEYVANEAELKHLQNLKTGALLQASCVMGGLLAGASEAELSALKAYGSALGLIFQITDDMLDVTADSQTLGKTAGKDAAQGKATFVTCLGMEASTAYVARLLAEGETSLSVFEDKGSLLFQILAFVAQRTF